MNNRVDNVIDNILKIYDIICKDENLNIFYYNSINEILDYLLECITITEVKKVDYIINDVETLINTIFMFIKNRDYNFSTIEDIFNELVKTVNVVRS